MSFGEEPTGQLEPTEERSARRRSERKRRKDRARAAEADTIVGGRRRGRRREHVRRLPALVVLVAAVAGLVVAEAVTGDDRQGVAAEQRADDPAVVGSDAVAAPSARPPVDAVGPVASPVGALGATWFCAGGTATDDGTADHAVVVANPGPTTVRVTVTAFPGAIDGDADGLAVAEAAEPAAETLTLGPDDVVEVRVGDLVDAPFAGALVELSGGTGVVEHTISGDFGVAAAPCATSPSSTWYLAAGDTTLGARELIVLFNPFPDDAVADLTFATTEGFRAPQQYANLVVPGQRVLVLDVGAVVTRVPEAAATITTRSGRLVVDRIQSYDGEGGGTDLTPAAPRPAPVWTFPDGLAADGITETVTVYNPTERQAEVDVEFIVDTDADDPDTELGVEPVELSIAPESYAEVVVNDEERVPPDIAHSIVVRTQNDVPVVAERWTRSAEPGPRRGLSATLGAPLVATTWYLAAGATSGDLTQFLTVVNPSPATAATVDVATLAGGRRLEVDAGLEVPVGGRLVVDLGAVLNRDELPLVVTASVPVVVERGLYGADGTGLSRTIAIPAREGASLRVPEG